MRIYFSAESPARQFLLSLRENLLQIGEKLRLLLLGENLLLLALGENLLSN